MPLAEVGRSLRIELFESDQFCNFVICKCDSLARVSAHLGQLYSVELLSTALFVAFECLVLPAVQ